MLQKCLHAEIVLANLSGWIRLVDFNESTAQARRLPSCKVPPSRILNCTPQKRCCNMMIFPTAARVLEVRASEC